MNHQVTFYMRAYWYWRDWKSEHGPEKNILEERVGSQMTDWQAGRPTSPIFL